MSKSKLTKTIFCSLVLICCITSFSSIVLAYSIGPSTATTATNVSGWTNWTTTQLSSKDDQYATTNVTAATATLSGFDFSGIPAGAIIDGIVVHIQASESQAQANGYLMTYLSWDNGTSYTSGYRTPESGELPISDTDYDEGGESDDWGHSWTVSEVTSTFKVKIWGYCANTGRTTNVDYVAVTVHYSVVDVSNYTGGTPTVPPISVDKPSTGNCLGTFKFDGGGTISQITITEYGTCDADNDLENVKLFEDDGDGDWESGNDTTQLGSTTTFNVSNEATFSSLNLTAGSTCYVHVVLDVNSNPTDGETVGIELYQNDIVCTSTTTASSWPVQLGTSTIGPLVTVSEYSVGTPSAPWTYVSQGSENNLLGTFKFDGSGSTVTAIIIHEYGSCDADSDLENVKLYQDDGDGNWEPVSDTTQLGSTTSFNPSDEATFSGFSLSASTSTYVHVVADVKTSATLTETVGVDITAANKVTLISGTVTASSWPVQLGTTEISGYFIYVADTGNNRIVKRLASDLSYVVKIGTYGAGNDEFDAPYGIAADKDYIYVADRNNNRVVRRNKTDLSYVDQVTSANSANLNGPRGVSSDGTYVYIGDYANHRVLKLNRSDLSFVAQAGETGVSGTDNDHFNSPSGITFDEIYLYITDSVNHRIMKRKISDLSYVDKIGSQGTGDDQFNKCYGMAVYSGYIFVGDEINHRVVKRRTSNLSYVAQQGASPPGTSGTGDGEFNQTKNVATDDTYAYVCDGANNRIQKFNQSDISFVSKIGGLTAGSGNDQFNLPRGMAHDTLPEHTTVSDYTDGTPTVPPATIDRGDTGNCLGTFHFSGSGTVSQITLTEYGTCDADSELENVKLFKDDGDGNWESGDDTTQLGSTTTFNASNKATFSSLSLTAGSTCYIHVVLDVLSTAVQGNDIGIETLQASDVTSTKEVRAVSWSVQLGSSTITVPQITVSNYTGGTPAAPPEKVYQDTTKNCLGTFLFDGKGTISQVTLTEHGSCDATTDLDKITLFQDDGDGDWKSGDDTTQLGSTTTFSGSSSTATFSGFNLTAGATSYVHVVLDVLSAATTGQTVGIELYQDGIVCTSTTTASSWPVQLGTSTINIPQVTISNYTGGSPSVPPNRIDGPSTHTCVGTFLFDGTGDISQLTLIEYGTCDADSDLENVKLFQDDGDGDWEEAIDTTQLGSTTTFNASNKATFSSLSIEASLTAYVHVVLDVTSSANDGQTVGIELYHNDIVCTSTTTASSWPVQLGESTINWWDSSWLYRKKLTFDNSSQTENLTDFPVLVKLTSSTFDFSLAQSNGEDIRFVDEDDNTELKYEIEKWDSSNEEAYIWVKVPQIDGSSNEDFIYMYYGNSQANDNQDAANVWTNGYEAVWHLEEEAEGTGTADVYKNSVSDNHHGDDYVSATEKTGKIGSGQEFDGSNDYIEADSVVNDMVLSSSWTIVGFIKIGVTGAGNAYAFVDNSASERISLGYISTPALKIYSDGKTAGNGSTLSIDTWYHTALVWDGSDFYAYLDGLFDYYVTPSLMTWASMDGFHIGNTIITGSNADHFNGFIDEVRVSNTRRSADWIAAQYKTMKDTFTSVGNEEAVNTVVSNYTGGTPTVPPSTVDKDTTNNCLGTFKFAGSGTISEITITEYGTSDANNDSENVKLFEDDGDGNWESGDDTTQLGSTTTFSGASSTATFSGFNLTAGATAYVHVVLDVKDTATYDETIGIEILQSSDVTSTKEVAAISWAVELGTSTISPPQITVSNYTGGTPTVPPNSVTPPSTDNCLGTFKFDGEGTISQITLTEYGTCDADNHLENVKLFQDANGEGNWNESEDTTQLGSTTTFNASNKATFSSLSLTAGSTCYVHVVLDVKSTANDGDTVGIELYQDDIICTSTTTATSWPVQLGTSTVSVPAAISLVQQKVDCTDYDVSADTTQITISLDSPATAGNLIVTGVAIDKASGEITAGFPAGFTLVHKSAEAAGDISSGAMAYKIATGGEQDFTWKWANLRDVTAWVGEWSGLASSDVFDVSAENETKLQSATNSMPTGTTGTTEQADELAIAIYISDSGNSVGATTSWSWDNGFTTIAGYFDDWDDVVACSGSPFICVSTKTLTSIGTVESTFSHGGSDECYAVIATFKAGVPPTTVSKYASGTPTVPSATVYQGATGDCLGTFKFDGVGTISTMTITEYGTCVATAALTNVKLYQDDGDGNWESGDDTTQLGSTTTFSGSSSTATFSGLNLTAGDTCYVHVVLDVLSAATTGQTVGIELYQDDIICTSTTTASSWPVQLGTSTIITSQVTVSNYTEGSPSVPPSKVYQDTTENCLGTFKFDGVGTISQITLTEYGNCEALNELENVKLFQDDGDGNWESGDDTTQLGSTTTFSGSSSTATFSGLNLTAGSNSYVHIVLDVLSTATTGQTVGIELYQDDIICTSTTTASSWPVQLGTSTIITPQVTVSNYTEGSPSVPPGTVYKETTENCLGTFRFDDLGTISQITITEYGNCDATTDLENVKLFQDDGDGDWESSQDTTQLGATTSFDVNKATFSSLSLTASATCYVHVVLDVNANPTDDETVGIELYQDDIVCTTTTTASGWPVQLGTSNIATYTEEATIAFIADGRPRLYGDGESQLTNDLNQIDDQMGSGWTLDAVQTAGDMDYISEETDDNFDDAYEVSDVSTTPVFYNVGNHEIDNSYDMPVLRNKLSGYSFNPSSGPTNCEETTYSYDVGDIHVVVLNEYFDGTSDTGTDGDVVNVLFDWLKDDLRNTTKPYKFIVGHEPAYPIVRHVGDSLDGYPDNRNRFWNLLKTERVMAYFTGHDHNYQFTEHDGVFECDTGVTGGMVGGSQMDDFATIFYAHCDVNGIQIRAVKEDPSWASPTVVTKTRSDLQTQVMVNTAERAGTECSYFIDYTAADESNPDWTGNNSSKWWESAFSTTTANWSSGELCVGYDTTLAWPWMNTTIDDMSGVYGVFIRVPFTGYDKSSYTGMELQVDYDDAVTVWLNGTEIHKSANAPTVGADDIWDKPASSAHTADGDGDKNPDYTNGTYDVTSYMSSLDEGSNFLAIGNWNNATTSTDLAAGIKLYLTKEISTTTVSGYTSGTPSVPPTTVDKPSTGNCLGTFKFDGVGTVSEITLTEYGTCDAPNDLENVKLFQDDGDGNWESGQDTTQLGSTTTFSGASSTATFSGLSLTAGTSCYVHVVLDVKSSATTADTIGIKISASTDIESTASLVEADSWPVQLGTSNIGVVTVVSNYTGGTPTVPPSSVTPPSTHTCLGTFKLDGEGTISQITLTEYGTCEADSHLENVKLFEDDGDGNWESGDDTTQLGSTTTFSGASSTATFSGLNLTAGSTCYVHVVLDVKSTANNGDTIGIELYQGDIVCTSTTTASSWPVQLGTSIITVPTALWTAYNDCGDDYEGQDNYDWASTGNVTNIGGENSPSSGELIKYSNSTGSGVTLALSGTPMEGYGAEHGHPTENATITRTPPVAAPAGTEAYDEFGTIVNVAGITYADTGNTLTLTLSGLSDSKTYTLVVLGARGRYSEANSQINRWCRYTISDVTSFINSSSSGAEISTTIVTDDTVTYLAGDNYNENNGTKGDYAKWTSIVSGDDGDVVVTISGVVHGADPANKAYLSAIKLIQEEANIAVSKYTSGSPTVPPEEVVKGTTENCLGTFKFNGSGTVSQIILTEYGTCDADSVLENVKLFQDDGNGSWASGDDTTQLGSTTTFNASNKATFSSLSLPAGSTCYAHIVLDVLSGATTGQTIGIELYQDDIICTSTTTATSWPVKLGTSTIVLPDTTAPSAVTNLSGLTGDYYAGQIELNWTAPGDDGTSGDNKPTAYYTLKYATYSVSDLGGDTTAWWNSAFTYSQSWDVSNQGETEDKTLLGFTPGATYWFAIKTTDDKDNTSFIDTLAGSSQAWVVAYQVQAGTNKYDYSESTGVTRWAWKYLLGNNVAFDVNTKEQAYVTKTDFTETMYATIEAPEETSYESFSDKFPVKYTYTFQISEYEDYVSSLHGWIKVQSELDDTSNYNLYIWNETNTQWEQLDTSNVNDAWEVLNGTISATCSNYIDSENKVSLAFYKEDPGNQPKYIWTDYVYLEVSVSPPTDTEAPNAITNLSALTGDNPGKIALDWTAPGDDGSSGNNGAGAYYTVRCGTFPVVGTSSTTWWNHGSVLTYSQSWSVGAQGSGEDFIVDGLDPGVTYYFQVRTTDESNNQSAIDINGGSGSTQANAVAASAGDITEPEAITTLSGLTWTSQGEIKLTWTSPGDDGWNNDFDSGSEFDIRYSTVDSQSPAKSTTTFSNASLVSEFSPIPEPVTALWPYNMIVTGLTPGVTYYFAMKTRDEVPNWSGLSNGATAWAQVDDIAPEAITTLSGLTWTAEGEIKLTWTSPGDDGWNNDFDSGSEFDIRYSTVASQSPAKSTTTFTSASLVSQFSPLPTPVTALVEYSMTITGLTPGVTYYFAMKTGDEVPNWSGLSNGATTWAQVDDIAPEAITTLSGLTWTAEGEIKLTWTAPGDDGWNNDFDSGSEFDIRYSTITGQSPAKSTTTFEACSSVSEFSPIPTPVTALWPYSMTVTGLTPGVTYYFAIRTADNQSNWSDLSNGATTWAQVDVTVPEAITTLSGLTWTTEGEIKLTWTSPGDDGWNNDFDSGSEFDIRYSTADSQSPAISTTTFEACSLVSEFSPIPTPVTALWPYSMTVTGLTPGVTYYFAIRTADDQSNWSGLSNGATTWAQVDVTAPAGITDLTGLCDSDTGDVTLSWSTPGDDDWNNTLAAGSKYIIDYATYTIQWSTENYKVSISTSGVAPHTEVSHTITGLTGDTTWYLQIWTCDELANWSGLSNGATVWVNPILSVSISTDTINLGVVEPGSYALTVSSLVVTNNGNIKQKFKLKIVSEPNATWESVTAASPGAEQYRYSGIFRSTQPATSDFLPEDSFSVSTERTSSSADLARDGDADDQKGFNVPTDSTRNLWFKFEAPTSTDITTTQAIPLTITAEPYP